MSADETRRGSECAEIIDARKTNIETYSLIRFSSRQVRRISSCADFDVFYPFGSQALEHFLVHHLSDPLPLKIRMDRVVSNLRHAWMGCVRVETDKSCNNSTALCHKDSAWGIWLAGPQNLISLPFLPIGMH